MDEITKEFWLGLFWFSVAFGVFTIMLYGIYKSAGWKSTLHTFLWVGIGGFFLLGILGQNTIAVLGGVVADMVFVLIGIFVIKDNRSTRQPYEDRYQKYLEEKIANLKPTAEEWAKAKRVLQISDAHEDACRDMIMRQWHKSKLEELDDPFEWRLLYGVHSEEQGGDIVAYEKKVKKGIITGVIVFGALVATIIAARDLPPLLRYNAAIKQMNEGNTEEAIDKFTSLKNYKNADAYVYCCKAIQKAEAGDYTNAYHDFHMARDIYRLPKENMPESLLGIQDELEAAHDDYLRSMPKYYYYPRNTTSGSSSTKSNSSRNTIKKKTNSSKKTQEDDPLDAKSYGNPEDFYDDNYDDFFDYEEAEDYYYEHEGQ